MKRFQNKVAVVTGAAVGIGRAVAIRMAAEGAAVAAIDVNGERLEALRQEIEGAGGRLLPLLCDVSGEESVKESFEKVRAQLGPIDVLVNNAGLWRGRGEFLELTAEDWKKYIDVNLMGTVYCTREALPDMLESGWGRIVNVASVAGVYGNGKMSHYSATKGAMIAMTKALAKEVGHRGVLVNSVSPGSVTSSAIEDCNATSESELSYLGRTGSDAENANLICFLASDEASYLSGENIIIDGGRKKL